MTSPKTSRNLFILLGFWLLLSGSALQADTIRLNSTSADKNIHVAGDLLQFDGTVYRVRTPIGEVSLNASDVTCDGAACPSPDLVMGRDVRLQSHDDRVAMRGTLTGFIDGNYTLRTGLGELYIDAARVSCSGPGCPGPSTEKTVCVYAKTAQR